MLPNINSNNNFEGARSVSDYVGVFTIDSWREFLRHGGNVMGFNINKFSSVNKLNAGDRILCYLSKVSAFVGWMEVIGQPYLDSNPIWSDGLYPVRLPVKVVENLSLSNAVPIKSLKEQLSFMKGREINSGWSIYVRTSPRCWSSSDSEIVRIAIAKKTKSSSSLKSIDFYYDNSGPVTPGKQVKLNFKKNSRVMRVIQKTETLLLDESQKVIGSYDKVLSFNKVTGYSINVPIATTCRPTAVCLETCYFAKGAPSWTNSLKHQISLQIAIKNNPEEFAERVSLEYDQQGLSFLRWNGGGDLFPESVSVINYLGKIRPDIILWVVTRIPELAAQIDHRENVFIHFSLDKHSLNRRDKFLKLSPRSKNYFFSYQCEPNELPNRDKLGNSAVLFFDNYHPSGCLSEYKNEIICPLNGKDDIAETCVNCRRCFNGDAVKYEFYKK